jgi:hypothetical protein
MNAHFVVVYSGVNTWNLISSRFIVYEYKISTKHYAGYYPEMNSFLNERGAW